MLSPFDKTFDELLNGFLTDYQNQLGGDGTPIDVSQGSMAFIKSACMSSALWGIYKAQAYLGDQIFPDSADSANLERHVYTRGLPPRKAGESDADLLARLLDYIRRPPAGGNQYDYVKWTIAIQGVKAAYSVPLSQGVGTIDVIVVADETATGSEVPSSHTGLTGTVTTIAAGKLVDAAGAFEGALPVRLGDVVRNTTAGTSATVISVDSGTQLGLSSDIFGTLGQSYAIDSLCTQVQNVIAATRPVTAKYSRALPVALLHPDVTVTASGANYDKVQTAADVSAYLDSLVPGQTLFLAALWNIAVQNGADDVAATVPAAPVVPTSGQVIRPGVISVP